MTLNRTKSFILFCLFCCCWGTLKSQDYRAYARRYGIEEGLPHRQVNAVLEDRRGLIWAATDAGVVRFDGYRFNTYNKAEQGLSNIAINRLAEDGSGLIWAVSHNSNQNVTSLDILDPLSGKVSPAADFFKKSPLPVPLDRLHRSSVRHTDGTLFWGVYYPAGYVSYHPDKGWRQVMVQPAAEELKVLRVTPDKHIWGLMKARKDGPYVLVKLDETGKIVTRYEPLPGNRFDYYEGETGNPDDFFLVENAPDWHHRIFWEIKSNGERSPIYPPVDPAGISTSILARLEDGSLIFNEMRLFDDQNNLLLDLKKLYPGYGKPLEVAWLKDRRGGIWLGTAFGLIQVDIQEDHFQRFLYDESGTSGGAVSCRGLLEYNGQLFVNSERPFQGRYMVDVQKGTALPLPGGGLIYGIAADQNGKIWTDRGGTRADDQEGLVQINPLNGNAQFTVHTPSKVWCVFPENDQRYWLGCLEGLYVFNPQSNQLKKVDHSRFPEISSASVVHIGKDRQGNIWACTETGFYRLDTNGELAARYWSGGQGAFYLPFDNILHFYEDAAGVFWIGTRGDGLVKWDQKTNQKHLLFRSNGILNGYIYGIYEDDFGHLWMPTDYGIVQFDKQQLQVRHTWLTANGVAQNEFNRISHTRGKDGTLYFGGLNGVTAFHPKNFYNHNKSALQPYQLVLTNFFVLDESGRQTNQTREMVDFGKFQIHPGDRYAQIEFALLDFPNANIISYSWKTEGVDADWTYLSKPELRLSNLSAGTHHLRIRAQAAGGQWAENEISIYLEVLPPFYLRTWFLLLALALIALGVWYWQRRNIWERAKLQQKIEMATAKIQQDKKIIEQQTAELRQLDADKSRFFVNISHELRTPLTLMLGPLSSALNSATLDKNNRYLVQMANTHGKNLLGMVNQILDLSKLDAGRLEIYETPVQLEQELQRVTAMFEEHAQMKGIHFASRFIADHEPQVVMLDVGKFRTILNNLLSNALKYTPAGGRVTVEMVEADSRLLVRVIDTGRGIHPDDLPQVFNRFFQTVQPNMPLEGGTGIGLALCHELTVMMNGSIKADSELGKGSVFSVELPKKVTTVFAPHETETVQHDTLAGPVAGSAENSHLPEFRSNILVVEDNTSLRDYLQVLLSKKYTVQTAVNGQAALDLLNTTHFDCQMIISDIMMPVMDGYQLLERLKKDDRLRHIPVVMLTARADATDKLRALRIGVDDYLLKPFETEELLARIHNLLTNYHQRTVVRPAEITEEELVEDTVERAGNAPGDMEWLARLEELVQQSMGQFDMNAEALAAQMFTSRSQLFRKVKQITGLSLNEYIQEIRFHQARMLLEQKKYTTVKAVALSVGFKHTNHFATSYKKRFGKSPTDYFL